MDMFLELLRQALERRETQEDKTEENTKTQRWEKRIKSQGESRVCKESPKGGAGRWTE